ncbi:energy transducer TonB [Marinicella sp. S1101]|uniref:energy transducer TonB n=1 Tax=Marinicella marina TaxID=2996016 RepID=UPI002260B5C4|nr:energy transducer TonB [Marinicella marina]MCX7552387.1 energy transducer TonB [Marinicella marina]MDJ1139262.1 energy transducer TonB [Marinicella marina]
MKKAEKMKRNLAALGSMMFGTVLVLGTLILINDSENLMTKADSIDGTNIKIQKQKPKPKQEIRKPKPKPKPKRARQAPPTPLLGLNSSLGGLDLGLPDFSMDGLNGLDGDILGNGSGVIMTDDTVDQSPKAVWQAPMVYPPRARAKGIEGYVVFSLLIGITGEIEQVKIVESYPSGIFDEVAMQGINSWKFEPAQYQGQSVKSWAKQRIRFDLS